MSSVLAWIVMVTVEINVTNFVQNFLIYAFNPYTSIFANFTWGIIFGFMGAGIFVGSKSVITLFAYLAIVGIVFAAILPMAIIAIFGLILVFIGTTAFYVILVER